MQKVKKHSLEEEKRSPHPTQSALLRKQRVLLREDFVLTQDPKSPYEEQLCEIIDREGACSKAAGVLSKAEISP